MVYHTCDVKWARTNNIKGVQCTVNVSRSIKIIYIWTEAHQNTTELDKSIQIQLIIWIWFLAVRLQRVSVNRFCFASNSIKVWWDDHKSWVSHDGIPHIYLFRWTSEGNLNTKGCNVLLTIREKLKRIVNSIINNNSWLNINIIMIPCWYIIILAPNWSQYFSHHMTGRSEANHMVTQKASTMDYRGWSNQLSIRNELLRIHPSIQHSSSILES